MCEIFIRASEQSYAPETRSLRLHGVATSLRPVSYTHLTLPTTPYV